jgi:hypothetical protein
MLRRVDRMAGDINAFLVVIAIGLAMLDLAYFALRVAHALPPAVQAGASMP